MLLEKMSHIMKGTSAYSSEKLAQGHPLNIKRSLNRDQRKQELLKITVQNQQMLKRLQAKNSNYSVANWEQEDRERKARINNMCENPYILDRPSTKSNYDSSLTIEDARRAASLPRIGTAPSGQGRPQNSRAFQNSKNHVMI